MFLPDYGLHCLALSCGDAVTDGVAKYGTDESGACCFLDGFQCHEQGKANKTYQRYKSFGWVSDGHAGPISSTSKKAGCVAEAVYVVSVAALDKTRA